MTSCNPERRTTRRMLAAGALATVVALAGAAFMISRTPTAQPTAISAPAPIALSAPAPVQDGWTTLTPIEQGTLQPLRSQWARLDTAAKAHWIQIADRLNGRPSRAVARAAQHMAAWQRLSPAEQAQARLHYKLASRLSPAERERRWETYRASVQAARQERDESSRVSTQGSPSAAVVPPLGTQARSGIALTVRVRAVQSDVPPSTATTGDAS